MIIFFMQDLTTAWLWNETYLGIKGTYFVSDEADIKNKRIKNKYSVIRTALVVWRNRFIL